jgi:hypothetical protein
MGHKCRVTKIAEEFPLFLFPKQYDTMFVQGVHVTQTWFFDF